MDEVSRLVRLCNCVSEGKSHGNVATDILSAMTELNKRFGADQLPMLSGFREENHENSSDAGDSEELRANTLKNVASTSESQVPDFEDSIRGSWAQMMLYGW